MDALSSHDLLTNIKTTYFEAFPLTEKEKLSIDSFCAYAETWLAAKKPIGVSPAAAADSAFSIRFADGTDLSLFSAEPNNMPTAQPAIRVTGNVADSLRSGVPIVNAAVPITKEN